MFRSVSVSVSRREGLHIVMGMNMSYMNHPLPFCLSCFTTWAGLEELTLVSCWLGFVTATGNIKKVWSVCDSEETRLGIWLPQAGTTISNY